MNVTVISNTKFKNTLQPLIGTWLGKGLQVNSIYSPKDVLPDITELKALAAHSDTVMILLPSGCSPATAVSGPFLTLDSRKVPVTVVPAANKLMVKTFVDTAIAVHQRKKSDQPITLLGQRLPRYMQVTDKIYNELTRSHQHRKVFRWTSDVVFPGDMLSGINQGASVCLYMGHGRPTGWSGYYGVRAHHLAAFKNKPAAAIISLCCWTAGRKDVKYSFCESLVMQGLAAFAVGAIKPTLFTENTRWAVNFSSAIQHGVTSAAELVRLSCPSQRSAVHYRLFGDPTVPLLADEGFVAAAEKIKIYT